MNYGAMLGLSAMSVMFVLQILKIREGIAPQLLFLVVFVSFIVLGSINYRKNNNEFMSYGQGVGQGVLVSLFGSILLGFFTYAFFKFASPESLQEIIDMTESKLEDQGLSEDQIEMTMKMQTKIMTPGIMGIITIFTYVFLGLIVSLITAAILKKENPNPFGNMDN